MKPKTPRETEHFIRVICEDYPRRANLLLRQNASNEVLTMCALLNQAVDEAATEVYQKSQAYAPHFAQIMREDIAKCRGFAFSPLSSAMCEGSYKKYKRMVKEGIAKRLGL